MAVHSDPRHSPSEERSSSEERSRGEQIVAWAMKRRLVRAYFRYAEYRGPSLADGVTYRTLFSVFAAVLLGFSLAALWLGGNPQAMGALTETLDRVIPGIAQMIDAEAIQAPIGFTLVGIASLIGLVGAAIGAISSLRTALRMIADEVHDDGSFLFVIGRNLLVALGLSALLALAAGLSVLNSAGIATLTSWLGLQPGVAVDLITQVIGLVVVFAVDMAAIALVFALLSGVKTTGKELWSGAAIGGVGLIILQQFSSLFVAGATNNPLLASFAALIALLLWFNLSAQVILIASSYIVVAAREHCRPDTIAEYQLFLAKERRRGAEREVLAVEKEIAKDELRSEERAAMTL